MDIQIPHDEENWAYLKARIAQPRETFIFLYSADIGLKVENVRFGYDPARTRDDLRNHLMARPGWLRPEWLNEPWPEKPGTTDRDLLILTLLRLKAFLSMGSVVPDGPTKELRRGLLELFPEVSGVTEHDADSYEAKPVIVAISGRNTDVVTIHPGASGGRRGVPTPIVVERMFGRRPAMDVYHQNVLRIDVSKRLEAVRLR